MKIGLTGHSGFIGSNLKNYLQKDHEIILCKTNMLSFGDTLKFEEFKSCDTIIHLAGKNKGTDKEIIEMNVFGTFSLLNWCKSYSKPIILAGSDYSIDGAYKHSKDTTKALCKSYAYAGILNSMVLSLPKVIGPGCKPHYNSFVSTLIYLASKNELQNYSYLIRDINETIELVHVYDVYETIDDILNWRLAGYQEYLFTRYDGKFSITLGEIKDILLGKNNEHPKAKIFLDLVQWYKENPT